MKKTLLIAAAALAAGVISSQAQAVYSQNIVGYVNSPLKAGYNVVANPLDNSAGNSLTNLFSNPTGALDYTLIYVWNGNGYTTYTIDSSTTTGLADQNDNGNIPSPNIAPGTILFFLNNTGTAKTNTIAGTVHVDIAATGTQTVGTTTNQLGLGYNFVASKLPVAGGISSVLGLTNNAGALDYTLVYVPNINLAGQFLGYTTYTIDSSTTTGWADQNDNGNLPEPTIPVGQGFIFNNNTGHLITWTQSF